MPLEHLHPMVVHFPLVLLLQAALIDAVAARRGDDLAGPGPLALAGRLSLYAGALAAIAAMTFGYVAQGIAIDKGFADSLIEQHEGLGVASAVIFAVLALLRFGAARFSVPLTGRRGWLALALTGAGLLLLLTTAYHGGQLVYQHGVNVVPVKP